MFLNLATEIKKAGLSQKEFSKKVKINTVVFSRKLNGDSDWKLSEIRRILEFWNLKLSFDYLFENVEVQQVG
ncbi:MAG: helix-turn-helix transcriptional regulator [Clostridia bacterium]|nr:helix-turn-helix transcriptional regulator [Clostridia bacterium]